jgi:2-aminoethylphosphonate-pyruvate transaminase
MEAVDPGAVRRVMAEAAYTHVAMVHHETTVGTMNPIEAVGAAVRESAPAATYIVDSMSAFGACDVDLAACKIDFLVSSANKNIEGTAHGYSNPKPCIAIPSPPPKWRACACSVCCRAGVPGFAFALCRREKLEREGVHARSLSLDLLAQWRGLEANGQFRFTPPTHAILAFQQALREHEAEGGVAARGARYAANARTLRAGMARLGFKPYLPEAVQGDILTTFLYPDDPRFDFPRFYNELAARGMVIYPGKLTKAEAFRLGTIGRVFESDVANLVEAVESVLKGMGVGLPVRQVSDKYGKYIIPNSIGNSPHVAACHTILSLEHRLLRLRSKAAQG